MCSTDFCMQRTHWEPSAQTKAEYKIELVLSTVRYELNGNVIVVQEYCILRSTPAQTGMDSNSLSPNMGHITP